MKFLKFLFVSLLAQTQINTGRNAASYTVWLVGSQDPNATMPCNVTGPQGVPTPRLYDEAIVQGLPGTSGDAVWRCLRGTNGFGIWIQVIAAK